MNPDQRKSVQFRPDRGRQFGLGQLGRLQDEMHIVFGAFPWKGQDASGFDSKAFLQFSFDWLGGDFGAANNDHAARTSMHYEAAIRAKFADVTGKKIAMAEDLARSGVILEIP